MEKPMSLLSIETVLCQMKIENLWRIRGQNQVLKMISDGAPVQGTKKWQVRTVWIEEDRIGSQYDENDQPTFVTLKGTKQTRWVSPRVICCVNANLEAIQTSILPVSTSFCKNLLSINLESEKEESQNYFQSVLELAKRSFKLESLCLHIKNLTEAQLLEAFRSFNLDVNMKEYISISMNVNADLTPRFVEEFLSARGITKQRLLLIRRAEEGEEETLNRAAVLKFFENPNNVRDLRYLKVERMDREIAYSLIDDLQQRHANGHVFYQNGAIGFTVGTSMTSGTQIEFLSLV
ncbi:hypothetical protein GCK72_010522 [Caenorhabditis remanei]|uniref:Uncharacterized protein n=1 Tax=Caenorhabditis remanei TaxID=31234 RepID=A0A6A5H338_CAERE|nr:hypothetical protein GCK72_010522 [Caenorhabditis remanei]KAF1762260.1 hypothetical protein GCK72_010522 [Caenorhabditis remanei]